MTDIEMTETEVKKQQRMGEVRRISDRQMLIARDPVVMINRTRDEAYWNLERECERLDMKFDENKVEAVWEFRLELVTEKDPERLKRRETLTAWGQQEHPLLLAPDMRMARYWIDQHHEFIPDGTPLSKMIVVGSQADRALRGYRGMLLIVMPSSRGEWPRPWVEFEHTVEKVCAWGAFSTWTEILP